MRILGEIPHPRLKVTLMAWNQKYLVKIERGQVEQTYKIPEFELSEPTQLQELIGESFLSRVEEQLDQMDHTLLSALHGLQDAE